MRHLIAGLLAAAILSPAAAFADADCTTEPQDKWLTEEAMKAKIAEMGYQDIRVFKVEGSCHEIYGHDKDGKKVEVYFNPVDGSIVKAETEE